MATKTRKRIITSLMAAVLLLTTLIGVATAAPMAQEVSATEVQGTIAGGEFAEIWLGLQTDIQGNNIVLLSEWNRNDPASNGLGFYVLTTEQMASVLAGSNPAQNNLAAGTALGTDFPSNVIGAEFRATSDSYTLIVFNDSANDADFKLTATNALITDDSGNVSVVGAEEEMTDEAAAEDMADEEGTTTAEPTAEATEEATADAEATPTSEATTEATAPAADAEATETATPAPAANITPQIIEAQELSGELPEQYDQHYFGLVPSVKDGKITLLYAFSPQDSSELATRSGFWVLEQEDFNTYLDPSNGANLSELAIAAGSDDRPELQPNERSASFTASGVGPYTVVVFNNSTVPDNYTLSVDGGLLIDDSGQTTTMAADEEMTESAIAVEEGAADETTADTTDSSTEATTPGREGEPGGTYTVQSGDTLSLIANDIYGKLSYWQDICDYNQLDNCDTIEVGDVLQLPALDELGTTATAPASTTSTATAADETTDTAATAVTDTTAEEAPAVDATEAVTDTATTTDTADMTATDAMTDTESTSTMADTGSTSDATAADSNIMQQLEAAGNFTTLVNALQEAGLADALESAGPFTIFAPTDAAFDELPAGAMNSLLNDPTGYLTEILLFHVIDGEVTSSDIVDGEREVTQQGKSVGFEVTDNGIKVNGANIVLDDMAATNGVVHAIDAVILPPNSN